MSEAIGTTSFAPKNVLSIYNPTEFIPIDTTDLLALNLENIITQANTNATTAISANDASYTSFFTSLPTLTLVNDFSNNTPTLFNTTYTIYTFTSVSGQNYLGQIQGTFATTTANNSGYVSITVSNTTTTLVQLYCYGNFNDNPSTSAIRPITFAKIFAFVGDGTLITISYKYVVTPASTETSGYQFVSPTFSTNIGYCITTPQLSILTM
jgi:hypothetical protein